MRDQDIQRAKRPLQIIKRFSDILNVNKFVTYTAMLQYIHTQAIQLRHAAHGGCLVEKKKCMWPSGGGACL